MNPGAARRMDDFGFYLVLTDPVAGYVRCCRDAVRAGVRMVQLRMKDADRRAVLETAREMREITAGTATRFIVNDDPSIAAECGADGVHVGQGDMSVSEVRRFYPGIGIVGLSTHNLEQVRQAAQVRPDYVGAGPVFATPTKKIPDPVVGLDLLPRMVEAADCPAVAIGGIDGSNLASVIAAGARNWAVVRAVCKSSDPYGAIMRLLEIAERAKA